MVRLGRSPFAGVDDLLDTGERTFGLARRERGEDSVVDPECRVIGIDGLRIVDASIMPEIVNSNTHATVVMLAEKASDIILGYAN